MTVIAIMTGGLFPIVHLGRPWLFFWLLPLPNQRHLWINFRSPLGWDVFAICSYVTISALFLYMGMLPDLAILARRISGWRRVLYRVLSSGLRAPTASGHTTSARTRSSPPSPFRWRCRSTVSCRGILP